MGSTKQHQLFDEWLCIIRLKGGPMDGHQFTVARNDAEAVQQRYHNGMYVLTLFTCNVPVGSHDPGAEWSVYLSDVMETEQLFLNEEETLCWQEGLTIEEVSNWEFIPMFGTKR